MDKKKKNAGATPSVDKVELSGNVENVTVNVVEHPFAEHFVPSEAEYERGPGGATTPLLVAEAPAPMP